MTKSLAREHGTKLVETIVRRLNSPVKGMGYWAAVDAVKHMGAITQMTVFLKTGLKKEDLK